MFFSFSHPWKNAHALRCCITKAEVMSEDCVGEAGRESMAWSSRGLTKTPLPLNTFLKAPLYKNYWWKIKMTNVKSFSFQCISVTQLNYDPRVGLNLTTNTIAVKRLSIIIIIIIYFHGCTCSTRHQHIKAVSKWSYGNLKGTRRLALEPSLCWEYWGSCTHLLQLWCRCLE